MSLQKVKGNQGEIEVLHALRDAGIDAQRVVGSGNVKEDDADIVVRHGGNKYNLEVKFHKKLPIKRLIGWRGDNEMLIMRENRGEFEVLIRLGDLIKLIKG